MFEEVMQGKKKNDFIFCLNTLRQQNDKTLHWLYQVVQVDLAAKQLHIQLMHNSLSNSYEFYIFPPDKCNLACSFSNHFKKNVSFFLLYLKDVKSVKLKCKLKSLPLQTNGSPKFFTVLFLDAIVHRGMLLSHLSLYICLVGCSFMNSKELHVTI